MKKVGQIIFSIVLVITVIVTLFNVAVDSYKKREEEKDKVEILEFLERKYGDGDFKIESISNHECTYRDTYESCYGTRSAVISTRYMKDDFTISYYDNFNRYSCRDTFLETYYKDARGDSTLEEYLKKALAKDISKSLLGDKYDDKFTTIISISSINYEDRDYGKIPDIEDLTKDVRISNLSLSVGKYYTKDKLNEFEKDLIAIHKKAQELNNDNYYFYNTLYFEFENGNPFVETTNTYYKDKGSLKLINGVYKLYLSPEPIELEE